MSGLIQKYILGVFNNKKVNEKHQESLWQYYYNKLSKGVDVGWNEGFAIDDKALVKDLKQSIAEFSAFKATSFKNTLESLLIQDGKLSPWNEFKKEAYKVSGDYNARWLETEYHQTVANANAAAQWKDMEQNTDLYPNVKLVSVHDARVRPEHKVLDGTIRPYNDPFWATHVPPLDWACRCYLEQTDEEPTDIKGGLQLKLEFENNPAQSGKIFGESAYEKGLTKEEKVELKEWVSKNRKNNIKNKTDIEKQLSRYEGIEFRKIEGIQKGTLEIFTTGKQNKQEYVKNKNAFSLISNQGGKYRMLPVIMDGNTNPDGYNLMRNCFVDIKVTTSNKGINIIQNSLKEADVALCQEVIIHITHEPTSYRDLYIGLKLDVLNGRNKNIKFVNIIFPDGKVKEYDYKKLEEKIKARLK